MTPKIFDFVIQYQDSEGLRRSIPYAAELLAKERKEIEAEIILYSSLRPCNQAIAFLLSELSDNLLKVQQAEAILARLGYRADTGAWEVHA